MIEQGKQIYGDVLKLKAETNELKMEVEKLRNELEHRDSILELTPNVAVYRVLVDADYHNREKPYAREVVYVSPNFSEISGVDDPSNQSNWFAVIHPDDIDKVLQVQADAANSGLFDVTMRTYHQEKGGWRWLHATSKIIFEVDGSPKYVNGMIMDVTDYKRTENRLLAYQERLRALNDQITVAEEKERRRVAEVLHDDVGQDLALALFKLNQAKERHTDIGPVLKDVAPLIEQAISYTRSLTKELCPPALCQMGLVSGLEWLADRMKGQYGIETDLDVSGDLSDIEEDLGTVIFRVIAELLNNVAKHAGALKADVNIKKSDGRIHLRVTDDGCGFEYSQEVLHQSDGFGLFMITERLYNLSGNLQIRSEPGKGTDIVAEIPF